VCSLFFQGRLSPAHIYNHLYSKGSQSQEWETFYRMLSEKAIEVLVDSSGDLIRIHQAQFVPMLFPQFKEDFLQRLKGSKDQRLAVLFLMEAEREGEAKQLLDGLPRGDPTSFFERFRSLTEMARNGPDLLGRTIQMEANLAYADLASRFGVSALVEDSPLLVQRILTENNPEISEFKSLLGAASGRGGGGGFFRAQGRDQPCHWPSGG